MLSSDFSVTTHRLALRRFTIDDLDWLAALYSDVEVTRYLGGAKDRDSVEIMLRVRIPGASTHRGHRRP